MSVTETEQFLATMSERITEAETALHQGDATLRLGMWSRTEPLTLFGAATSGVGWAELEPIFEGLGRRFSTCTSYRNEIVAAEARGDLAYIAALEHVTASIDRAEPKAYVLRATTVFRREAGQWKFVHRHGDALTSESGVLVRRLAGAGPAPERAGRRTTVASGAPDAGGRREPSAAAAGDLDDFLATALPRQVDTEFAWHQGDPDARLASWSDREPVTLFGAGGACRSGSDEVRRLFRRAVTEIVPCRSLDYDLLAAGADGELAYTVGYEHVSFGPGPVRDDTLRVTYLHRREGGEWKIVHRHGDRLQHSGARSCRRLTRATVPERPPTAAR
jgi:ketosteroid isomerase-like protein